MRRGVMVLLVLGLLATRPASAQAPAAKVKIGVLKLTASAVLFVGVEKGYFREFGIEPELVYFQAAQPIAVALASGDIPVGATGLTAGLFNIVAGGVHLWIVADKGREWPNHNLTALVVRKDLYDGGVRSMRDLKGKKVGVTQIGSTFHYNVGRYLEKEGLAPGDVEVVPLQALPALNDALTARRVDAVATAEPFVSRLESTGAGVSIIQTGDAFPWQIATVLFSDRFARDRAQAVAFMKGYVKASRHYFDAVLTGKAGPDYDEVVAITARYTGATPDLIRKGFPYQDRDGRLMPGDVARQLAWWHTQKLVKTPVAEKDIVDESFLRDALRGLK
jgi:NitT/TauT family transport system substrate-binding protein